MAQGTDGAASNRHSRWSYWVD